jgi:uncharacterized protein (DUF58 family)
LNKGSVEGVTASVDELLQLRFKASGIPLQSRRLTTCAMAGGYVSKFRSRGIDYQESRNYQPGDDIRTMDWRVTARTGRPHTKLYREERERPVIVLVELGPGMFFGTRTAFKSVIAARVAALLAWAAVHQGDRIGALLFGQGRHQELRPLGGQRGALRLIRELVVWTGLDNAKRAASQALSEALGRLRRVVRPGSLIVMVSDFYSLDPASEQHLVQLRRHNDMVACQILDTLERLPPPPGRYGVTDDHHGLTLETFSVGQQDRYAACLAEHHDRVERLLHRRAIPLLRLLTHEDVAESLRRGLMNLPPEPVGRMELSV